MKSPIAILGLVLLTLVARWNHSGKRRPTLGEVILLSAPFCIFVIASSQTEFTLHLRYVHPVIAAVVIFVSQSLSSPFRNIRRIGVALVITTVISTMAIFPHQMTYFNEFVDGSGWRHLQGSSFDWGQDDMLIEDFLSSHPDYTRDDTEIRLLLTREHVYGRHVWEVFLASSVGHSPSILIMPIAIEEEFVAHLPSSATHERHKLGRTLVAYCSRKAG